MDVPENPETPVPPQVSKYFAQIGSKGGKARLEKLSESQRKRIAKKAAARSAEVRRQRALQKKQGDG
jgi:hypothetical protein